MHLRLNAKAIFSEFFVKKPSLFHYSLLLILIQYSLGESKVCICRSKIKCLNYVLTTFYNSDHN